MFYPLFSPWIVGYKLDTDQYVGLPSNAVRPKSLGLWSTAAEWMKLCCRVIRKALIGNPTY